VTGSGVRPIKHHVVHFLGHNNPRSVAIDLSKVPCYYFVIMSTNRTKNNDGKFAAKRFDTKISTIEKQYNIELGVRGNMLLGNYLKKKGYPSLAKMLQK